MGTRGGQHSVTLATLLLLCFLGGSLKLTAAQQAPGPAPASGPTPGGSPQLTAAQPPPPTPTSTPTPPSVYLDPEGVCPDGPDACFARFNASFPRAFNGSSEVAYRKGVFYANVQLIDARNRENRSYTLAVNEFADLTHEEFIASYTGAVPPSDGSDGSGRRLLREKRGFAGAARRSLLNLPSSVDWRTTGKLQPVLSQTCGTCWAHAATAVLETTFNIATGQYVKGSEEEMIDCFPEEAGTSCSGGGWPGNAMDWVKANGQTTAAKYPAVFHAEKSINPACDAAKSASDDITVDYVYHLSQPSEDVIKEQLVNAPVVVLFAVGDDFQFYSKGVFDGPCDTTVVINHAMAAVGYGSENGDDFWIVRNSWGATWGEAGYVRIKRGVDQPYGLCNIQYQIDWATKKAQGYCQRNNPCQNNGQCIDGGSATSFQCNCVTPYEGTYCERMQTPDCFSASECDFYFEGYQSYVPTLYLGPGTGDNSISPAIINSKDGGQHVNVINTNQGYGAYPPIPNDNQNQFYGGGNFVRDRTFNNPQNVNDFRGKCIKLRLSSVQLSDGNNLNPNDGNGQYPEERRCVAFRTA
ncbi:hypothetical protein KFL_003800010 [Klebsormidium nitens]|uniref:EGF-like domain-containing protein n=1 Tax=Klebsormidium nitens TaxID=105231 RepID=A0A1Y1IA32_KLENI|nr:hypothetical protein KFL_003800010 [Klebsormidium nitens]|eukprot:GAQ87825.1 hypothetical protein KFL_003800010 [Klebsormidium nitens]